MHYLSDAADGKAVTLGNPSLEYVDYCDEAYQLHPRGIHSHHGLIEILYVLRGEGRYEINGRVYPVHSGDLVIYNSDAVHNECLLTPPPPLYGFGVSGVRLDGLPADCLVPPDTDPVLPLGERASEFRTMFRLLYEHASGSGPGTRDVCQALMRALLYMIVELIEGRTPAAPGKVGASGANALGKELQAYIERHALEELSTQSVAETFGISTTYMSRLFKQATGTSMMQYVIQRRIGEAQTLLLITELPVTEIARRVGYDNLSHFVKLFTQHVGISPRKYRKNGSALRHAPETKNRSKNNP